MVMVVVVALGVPRKIVVVVALGVNTAQELGRVWTAACIAIGDSEIAFNSSAMS